MRVNMLLGLSRVIEATGRKADLAVEPVRDSKLRRRDLTVEAANDWLRSWQPSMALLEICRTNRETCT
jgi:hypothetical protein